MPKGLRRFHASGDRHFITCSCYRRQQFIGSGRRHNLFLKILEEVRQQYDFVVWGYVVMPEHFHLLIGNATPQQCSTAWPYLPNPAVVNKYDEGLNGIGLLTSLTDQAGSGIYTYDVMGQIKTEQRTIGSATKSMSYDYNLHGGVVNLHYPSGAVIHYTNQSAGRPTAATDTTNSINYVAGPAGSLVKYAPDGSISTMTFGFNSGFAGISSMFMNDPRLQPCRITASTGALPTSCADTTAHGNVFDIAYDFSLGNGDNGNVLNITNYKDASRNQSFGYDSVNRLTSAQNAGSDCSLPTVNGKTKYWGNSYIYDEWGNLKQKIITKCGAENLNVTALPNNQLLGYEYDAAGNMTNDPTDSVTSTYDQENRISVATKNGVATTYVYDADGDRVQKSNSASGTLYWYMVPGIVAESDLNGNLTSEYIFFDGERVARRDLPSGSVAYYFSDHLKTASVITDASGNIKSESDFYPWGGELQFVNNDSNHYKFTGKERDLETGLDYFGARYYSNGLGRFITPDWAPTTPKPSAVPYADWIDPQSLNQYSYVRNLPTTKLDKDGHDPGDKFKNKTAAAADAVKYIRGRSDGYKNEYGTRIEKNGKSYSYKEPVTQGKPGGVDLQPLQKNDVGDVHTHNYGVDDAHANSIEQPDRIGTVQDKDKVQKMQDDPKATVDYQSYVGAPNGDVIQFTPNPNAPDGLGDSKTVQHNVAPDPNPPPPPPTPTPKKEEPK